MYNKNIKSKRKQCKRIQNKGEENGERNKSTK